MRVIFPIVFYLLNTTSLPPVSGFTPAEDTAKIIYLVKIKWHTGIIFNTSQVDTLIWKFIKDFKAFRYVDIGWGDADFYQHPGFDPELAARALFMKTDAALRVAGFNRGIDDYLQGTDYAERIIVDEEKFDRLCRYIQFFYFIDKDSPVILSQHLDGAVRFYKAKGCYTLFNTCNTWIAAGLDYAGYKINPKIILSEELFRQTVKLGEMVKAPD